MEKTLLCTDGVPVHRAKRNSHLPRESRQHEQASTSFVRSSRRGLCTRHSLRGETRSTFTCCRSLFRSPDSHHYPVVLDLINIEAHGGDDGRCDPVHVLELGLCVSDEAHKSTSGCNTSSKAHRMKPYNTA